MKRLLVKERYQLKPKNTTLNLKDMHNLSASKKSMRKFQTLKDVKYNVPPVKDNLSSQGS